MTHTKFKKTVKQEYSVYVDIMYSCHTKSGTKLYERILFVCSNEFEDLTHDF